MLQNVRQGMYPKPLTAQSTRFPSRPRQAPLVLSREIVERFGTRSPNFQKQLFGAVIAKAPPLPKQRRYKSVINIRKEATLDSLLSTGTKTQFTVNLEQIVKIAAVYGEIMRLFQHQDYAGTYDKCVEWRNFTEQGYLSFFEDIGRSRLEQERRKKLELLAITSTQYLAHWYHIELHCAKPDARMAIVAEQNVGVSLALSALMSAHQGFLIAVERIYRQLPKSVSATENRWVKEIGKLVGEKLVKSKDLYGTQALHNEAVISLLRQLCNTKAQLGFFITATKLLDNIGKISYFDLRGMMYKELSSWSMRQTDLPVMTPFIIKKSRTAKQLTKVPAFEPLIDPILPENKAKAYTLVLDLDETLMHNLLDGNSDQGTILVRPGATEFLKELSDYYELIVFTAGTKEYADWALDFVDPTGLILYKLHREHAVQKNGVYIKDLSKIGRDLRKTIIIDNMVENFQFQPENGIYIKPWENDETDQELKKLLPILKGIVEQRVPDVRIALRNYRDRQLRNMFKGIPIKRYKIH